MRLTSSIPGELIPLPSSGSIPELPHVAKWVVNEKKIAPHIPVVDKSGREDGSFSRDDFTFDKVRNAYICPQGKL